MALSLTQTPALVSFAQSPIIFTVAESDTNLITYVGIHELAHVMSIGTEHDSEFLTNFQFLLKYASDITYQNPFNGVMEKLYIPISELNTADNYCGVKIKNSIN